VTSETKNFGPGVIDGSTTPIDGTLTDVDGTTNVFMPDKSRSTWYVSLQDEWQFAPDWELTGGIRYDRFSDFGSTVNPRLALVWSARHNLTAKLLYGQAFRAPSFNELYSINNPVALGNPDLAPETINTLELAFDYRPTFDLQTNFTIFAYEANDLIEFLPAPGGTKTAQNARDQKGYGFEFETSWDITKTLQLGGNYAWQHSEDADTGKRIPDAPGQQLLLHADWKFLPDWSVRPQLNWVASRKRSDADSRSDIDDFTLVDLTLRRRNLLKNFELAVAVRNVFDEDAREPSSGPEAAGLPISIPDDYPLEGRSVWAEVRYRF
jgi:iron complex outermembrane receptor protein